MVSKMDARLVILPAAVTMVEAGLSSEARAGNLSLLRRRAKDQSFACP